MENKELKSNDGIGPPSKRSGFKKWMRRIAIFGILGIALYMVIGYFFNYSNGFRAGKIMKFSQKGYVFKTYEGQIYLGTITPDEASGLSSKYWDFSVDKSDKNVLQQIEDAMAKKHEVRLHYHEKLVRFLWRGETRYFVDSVVEVK